METNIAHYWREKIAPKKYHLGKFSISNTNSGQVYFLYALVSKKTTGRKTVNSDSNNLIFSLVN